MKSNPLLRRETTERDGIWRKGWTIKCSECGTEERKFWASLEDEEIAAKNFGNAGWDMRFTVCPACIKRAKTKRNAARNRKPKVVPMPQMSVVPKEPRKLTKDERSRIREMLEKHFDDDKGCYLDGYSDQKVGAELNVPWKLVADLREAAFGPIESDPEIDALQEEIAETLSLIKVCEGDIKGLKATVADLQKRVADQAARLR